MSAIVFNLCFVEEPKIILLEIFSPKERRRYKRNSGIMYFLDAQAENCRQHNSS